MKTIAASPGRGARSHICSTRSTERSESLFHHILRHLLAVLQGSHNASRRNGIGGLNQAQLRDIGLEQDLLPDWKPDPWRHLR